MLVASSNILIPDGTLVVELVAFLIVFYIIGKWILPPLNKVITERQAHIAESLKVIDEAKVEMEKAKASYEESVTKGRDDARSILEQANRMAEEIRAESRVKAETEYQRLVSQAEADIETARQVAQQELQVQAAELALQLAGKVIEAEIDPSKHRDLINRSIAAAEAKA